MPSQPAATALADLRGVTPWIWVICERCQHRVPTALIVPVTHSPWTVASGHAEENRTRQDVDSTAYLIDEGVQLSSAHCVAPTRRAASFLLGPCEV